ncbi:uncharacterized protein LOC110025227 [Phalaenopsis equestris]|uniref:uncharacterized protein LOC110025227 n=1 Tax=Phalaenopsis equestris TaxID=78828 RepID=UPI0009E31543|nr:uncharacterized protein LOC110025227 [Phalaenopsis equestris]XP_020581224.1 uncharacterized protein LOC110025227 [Phalaenopsis equestris]XP_020581225.1 uncharacterized protein LOC110025227 [Phalaenopsis equestris]
MIHICTCHKRFTSSPLEIPEGQESSRSCSSCGGICSVDEPGSLSKRMWSTLGAEFSGVIDPQLKWKTSSNGKQRALRRARNFTQDNRKKYTVKNREDIEDLSDETSKKEGDMLVSESEKFGVSVLSRRFSDNLESVPIKKRRFSLLPSKSTPLILSSSGFRDHNYESGPALLESSQVSLKRDESGMYSSNGLDWSQKKSSADEKRFLEDIDERSGDSADFSGISILAAAACYSSIERGFMDGRSSTIKGHSFDENPSSLRFSESLEGMDQPSKLELGNKPKPSMTSLAAGESCGREPDQIRFDECKRKNYVGSLQSLSSNKKLALNRDDRLHWDLNTVMDVWETHSDDFSISDPLHSHVKSNGSHDTIYGNQGLGQDEAVFGINKVGLIAADNKDISQCFEEGDGKHVSRVADCDKKKSGLPGTQVCESLQEECQFKDARFIMANAPEKTCPAGGGENCCIATINAHPIKDCALLDRDLSTKAVNASDEKYKTDNVNLSVEMYSHNALPSLNAFDPFAEDKNVNEMLHDDNIAIDTVGCSNDHSGEYHPLYVGEGNLLRSPHSEKHQSISADVTLSITVQKSPAGQLDQSTSGVIIQEDEKTLQVSLDGCSSKTMTTYGCLADETACTDEFGKAYPHLNQSTASFDSKGTSYNEQLPSINACNNKYKVSSTDLKVDDCKSYIFSAESLTASTVASLHTSPKLTNSISEGFFMEKDEIPLADNTLILNEESETVADGHVQRSVKDSLEHFDSEHYSDACPFDTDHATGLEKIDPLGDDCSQYEDGELRESLLNSWEPGVEEAETEHVDYGSDCREVDFFEAESDFCSPSELAVETIEPQHEGKLVSTFSDGSRMRVSEDDSQSKCFQKHFLTKDASNVNYVEESAMKIMDVSVVSEVLARDENRLLTSNVPTVSSDVPGKSIKQDSSRPKSSGWDKLPQREVDVLWNHDGASVTTSVKGEYARRTVVSSVKKVASSRVERSKSSETLYRKDASYTMENKELGHFALSAERSTNASRSTGRSKPPFRSHGRGRVECWVGSPEHRGSCRFDTSGHYSSLNFAPPSSRNATAAAVAKVENNGFVVAPDGTIVKAVSMGPGSHLSGRCSNSSAHLQSTRRGSIMESDAAFDMSSEPSNSTREFSPERCFSVGRGRASRRDSKFISLGHRNMYQAPMLDRRIDPLSLPHPSSSRQRSFSPLRRPNHLSRELTKSPTRSKTRSPHTWTPPRGRDNGRIRRIPRRRSPQHQFMHAEELSSHAPLSRSHSSPPHASRWFENERIFHDHLGEHQPRSRPPGRSPPARFFSQSNRLVRPDDCCQPIYSGRCYDYTDFGRGMRHDSRNDGRRGRSHRYESLDPEERLEGNGSRTRVHDLQPRPSVFQRRESPRRFDRSIDSQRKDSPRRYRGEMFHFRRGGDGKLNADYKPIGVRSTSDDMDLQRRPS